MVRIGTPFWCKELLIKMNEQQIPIGTSQSAFSLLEWKEKAKIGIKMDGGEEIFMQKFTLEV